MSSSRNSSSAAAALTAIIIVAPIRNKQIGERIILESMPAFPGGGGAGQSHGGYDSHAHSLTRSPPDQISRIGDDTLALATDGTRIPSSTISFHASLNRDN